MWGIIPAAGNGTRIQPLAFSKELLPVGSRQHDGTERPRAVSEYLIERMVQGGADKICFVISRWKFDILQYFGGEIGKAAIVYAVQPEAKGLCDAIFRAVPFVDPAEPVLVGLPDTIWLPVKPSRCRPEPIMSMSVRWAGIARRCAFLPKRLLRRAQAASRRSLSLPGLLPRGAADAEAFR